MLLQVSPGWQVSADGSLGSQKQFLGMGTEGIYISKWVGDINLNYRRQCTFIWV